jgi:hypothetical protein
MARLHGLGMFVACIILLAPLGAAQNLGRYRDFEFGMSVDSVAKQTQSPPASIRTVHTMPDLIQTLQWDRPSRFSSSTEADPVRGIRFHFYNNQLFKIVAIYDNRQLEGMTADDLIEAISKIYGPSSRPDESVVVSAYAGYEDRQKVLARWESGENTYSLYRSSYGGEFGLVADTKKLEGLAAESIREAQRLEVLAAPQREIERRQKEVEDRRVAEEKARSVNKPNFRP